ncbi:hypothetical protein F9K79_21280 [Ochrobactrum sp. Kaboul]|nr:hypothetical protein F9K79_21280 [Ochrobactrum sp. Kaboul]
MAELPQLERQLERFVARRLLDSGPAAWKDLAPEKRKEYILAARRALRAERVYFARQAATLQTV